MSYDSWLERPYVERAEQEAQWEAFCDGNGYDYDVTGKDDEFDQWVEGNAEPDPDDERDSWLESRWED
jgi:hypothetical protein